MGQWKRTLRNTGMSLTFAAIGAVAAETAASAHDGAGSDHVIGTVTALGTDSFTISAYDGTSETVDTTSTTAYAETGTTVPPTTVATGQEVLVALDPADTTPTAVKVTVLLDHFSGKVTSVTPTSITLSGPWNWSGDVVISSSTLYFDGTTAASGVTDGEYVTAFGTPDATTPTKLDALFVDIGKKTECTPRVPSATPTTTPGTDPWPVSPGGTPLHPASRPATAPAGSTNTTSTTSRTPTPGAPAGNGNGGSFGSQGGHGFGPGGGPGQGGHGFGGGGGGFGGRGRG